VNVRAIDTDDDAIVKAFASSPEALEAAVDEAGWPCPTARRSIPIPQQQREK